MYYSASMPTAARGHTPVLFGDFLQGYVIGDRGGSGIDVKILDQPLATQGQIALLGFRRVDGRVRRSAAIQAYNVAASSQCPARPFLPGSRGLHTARPHHKTVCGELAAVSSVLLN